MTKELFGFLEEFRVIISAVKYFVMLLECNGAIFDSRSS